MNGFVSSVRGKFVTKQRSKTLWRKKGKNAESCHGLVQRQWITTVNITFVDLLLITSWGVCVGDLLMQIAQKPNANNLHYPGYSPANHSQHQHFFKFMLLVPEKQKGFTFLFVVFKSTNAKVDKHFHQSKFSYPLKTFGDEQIVFLHQIGNAVTYWNAGSLDKQILHADLIYFGLLEICPLFLAFLCALFQLTVVQVCTFFVYTNTPSKIILYILFKF